MTWRLAALSVAVLLVTSACVTITPVVEPTVGPSAAPGTAIAVASTPPPPSPVHQTPTARPAATPPPGTQEPTSSPTTAPVPTAVPTEPAITADPNDPACLDPAYTLEGFAWTQPFQWYFNRGSVPAQYDPDAVLAVIQRAFDNVTSEANDCGRPDTISATAVYMGETDLQPCTPDGDGTNVVAFGPPTADLSADAIAYTCPFTYRGSGEIAEADIVIGEDLDWALSEDTCVDSELLEPTLTHEVGHAFGLGHVSERRHPDLTMSTRSNGPCDNEESTLGLGDMLGLESLY